MKTKAVISLAVKNYCHRNFMSGESYGACPKAPIGEGQPGPEVIKLFSCSAQLRLKFILLIDVGILTFMSRINYLFLSFEPEFSIKV